MWKSLRELSANTSTLNIYSRLSASCVPYNSSIIACFDGILRPRVSLNRSFVARANVLFEAKREHTLSLRQLRPAHERAQAAHVWNPGPGDSRSLIS